MHCSDAATVGDEGGGRATVHEGEGELDLRGTSAVEAAEGEGDGVDGDSSRGFEVLFVEVLGEEGWYEGRVRTHSCASIDGIVDEVG